jgi:hypothetical protein
MLARLFPKTIDNTYRGHAIALWLFVLFVAVKLLQGANSMIQARKIAVEADGIPIDSYGPVAGDAVVAMFALLGLYGLILPVLGVVVLIRYRAMIPLMYLAFIAVQLGSRALLTLQPVVVRAAEEARPVGFWINLGLLAVLVLGLVLSLMDRKKAA